MIDQALLEWTIKKYKGPLDYDDAKQIALIALWRVEGKEKPESMTQSSFEARTIAWAIGKHLRQFGRVVTPPARVGWKELKGKVVDLEEYHFESEDPTDNAVDTIDKKNFYEEFMSTLSHIEKRVFYLLRSGQSMRQVGEFLGMHHSRVAQLSVIMQYKAEALRKKAA